MPKTGHFILHSNFLPQITAGPYELRSEQTGLPFTVSTETTHVHVAAPRFTMPVDQILSSFPPANAEGAFGDRLPQIVLKRRTLPWERNPAGADVVVYPSEHPEAFPAFLVETSAAARPIVCSPLSSFDEIVTDGETGRVIAGGITDYADATVELLEHPETGTWLAHAAQQRVLKAFDRPAVARATVAMYRDLFVKK
jgi:hypothetical protein